MGSFFWHVTRISWFSSDLLPSGLFFTVDAIADSFAVPHQQAGGTHHGYRKNINVLHGLKPRVVRHRFCAVRSGNVDAIGMVHICCSAGICICGMHVRTVDKCRHGGIGENMPLVDILNCRLILTAIGESIGSFCGGFFVPFLTSAFHATWMYWLALSIIAVCGLFVNVSERKCR